MSVGKGGQKKKKNGEKLGRRVSEAEREGIGCLLGASGSQNLQSSAADFLSDSLSLIFLNLFLFKTDVYVTEVNILPFQLAEKVRQVSSG